MPCTSNVGRHQIRCMASTGSVAAQRCELVSRLEVTRSRSRSDEVASRLGGDRRPRLHRTLGSGSRPCARRRTATPPRRARRSGCAPRRRTRPNAGRSPPCEREAAALQAAQSRRPRRLAARDPDRVGDEDRVGGERVGGCRDAPSRSSASRSPPRTPRERSRSRARPVHHGGLEAEERGQRRGPCRRSSRARSTGPPPS